METISIEGNGVPKLQKGGKEMRRTGKRLLALILVLAVAAAILPMPALAQNEGTDSKEPLQYDDRLTKEELLGLFDEI